jgi:hypothetical protein
MMYALFIVAAVADAALAYVCIRELVRRGGWGQ